MPASAGTKLSRNITSLANLIALGAIGLLTVLEASPLALALGFGALSLVLITQTILFWYDSAGKPKGRSGAEIVGGVSLIVLSLIALALTTAASLVAGGVLDSASITLGTIAPSLATILGIGFSTILVATALLAVLPFLNYLSTDEDYDQAKKSVRNFTLSGLMAVFASLALFVAAPASAFAIAMWSLAAVCLAAMVIFKGKDTFLPSSSSTVVPVSQDGRGAAVIEGRAPSGLFVGGDRKLGGGAHTHTGTASVEPLTTEGAKQSLQEKYNTGTLLGDSWGVLGVYNEHDPATQSSIRELTILTHNETTAKNILKAFASHVSKRDQDLVRQFKIYVGLPEETSNPFDSIRATTFSSNQSTGGGSSSSLNSLPSAPAAQSESQRASFPGLDE